MRLDRGIGHFLSSPVRSAGKGDREAVEGANAVCVAASYFVRATSTELRSGEDSRIPLGHAEADACLRGGIQRGALHEVFAAEAGCEAAASGFATALAMRAGGGKTLLWIRHDFSALEYGELAATGFLEMGLDPARVLLLRVADVASALRAAGDALSCAALGAVILEIPGRQKLLDLVTSRRLTLAAQKKGVSVFLLRFAAVPDASSAETRWRIAPAPSSDKKDDWGFPAFSAALARNRHGATGDWVMEWNSDEQSFCEADRGSVVSVPADGSAGAWSTSASTADQRRQIIV